MFPLGAMVLVSGPSTSGWGNSIGNNGVSWVALTLPYLEQNTVFNAINFNRSISGGSGYIGFFATAWYTRLSVLSCPSDGDQKGFRNVGSNNGDGQDISANPASPSGRRHADGCGQRLWRELRRQLLHRRVEHGRVLPDRDAVHHLAQSPGVSAYRLARISGHIRRYQCATSPCGGRWRSPRHV